MVPATVLFNRTASEMSTFPSRLTSPKITISVVGDVPEDSVAVVAEVAVVVSAEDRVVVSCSVREVVAAVVSEMVACVDAAVSVSVAADVAAGSVVAVVTVVCSCVEVAVVLDVLAVVVAGTVAAVVFAAVAVVVVVVVVVVAVVVVAAVVVKATAFHFWQALPLTVHCCTLAPLDFSAFATSTAARSFEVRVRIVYVPSGFLTNLNRCELDLLLVWISMLEPSASPAEFR